MTAFGLAARWAHLVCGLGLVGIFGVTLLAGESDRPTVRAWQARMLALTRGLVVGALASGLALLAYQSAVIAGRASALHEPAIWLRVLTESRFGTVWLVRHGLLLLLAALILLRQREDSPADAVTGRLEGWALAAVAGAAMAWAGHAAAAESLGLPALLGDAAHLVAAGTWLGALLPLVLLARASAREEGADARPYAVVAVRRFSSLALATMLILIITGLFNTWIEVGGVAALVGTPYGGLVLLKVALIAPILAFALFNRKHLLPALSGDAATVGRPAMRRLGHFLLAELILAVLVLMVTSGLASTVPGRHESPWWPLSFRLSYEAAAGMPGVRSRLFIGSQLAFLGLCGAIVGWLLNQRRSLVIAFGALVLAVGLWIALPPLAVDAYPTTYRRSPASYQAASIARGMGLYAARCATCHGPGGTGDGPGGAGLPRPPADLTAPHTAQHSAGDLFWWITHGIPRGGMPPFGESLSEDDRWDLINFLRALSSAREAGDLTARIEPPRARLAAPDFSYAVGPTPMRALRDFRDRRAVVLVLFSLPGSRARIDRLAERYATIQVLGGEILMTPITPDPRIIARLGGDPPILFPVVTDGADDIARVYGLFARAGAVGAPPPHAEFLVDRQGYLRARFIPGGPAPGWSDTRRLEDDLRALSTEATTVEAPDEHVH